jgi:hypothetical protein
MTGGRASRQKGNRTERAIVCACCRSAALPLSACRSLALRVGASVATLACLHWAATYAAKRSAAEMVFNRLYDWLGDRDFLVIRADRKPLLVIARIELAAEIIMAAERGKGSVP